MLQLLVRSTQTSDERYGIVRTALLDVAEVLPLSAATLVKADELAFDHGLELPDAIVLAAVLIDAAAGSTSSCFANRNTTDFDDPSIIELLRAASCTFIGNFEHALAHVESKLRGA